MTENRTFLLQAVALLPLGEPASGATIDATVSYAIGRDFKAVGTATGVATEFRVVWSWAGLAIGQRATVAFRAEFVDGRGVRFEGSVRQTLWFPRTGGPDKLGPYEIPLSKQPAPITGLQLSPEIVQLIRARNHGALLADDLQELEECLRNQLPDAAACVAGKCLDALLKVTGERDGWWNPAWDEAQLGTLLQTNAICDQIVKVTSKAFLEKLRLSMRVLRAPAVHLKYTDVSMDEARTCAREVHDLLHKWWRPPPGVTGRAIRP